MANPDIKKCGWSFSFRSKHDNHTGQDQEAKMLGNETGGSVTIQRSFESPVAQQVVECRFGHIGPDGEVIMVCARLALKELGHPLRHVRCNIDP